MEKINPSHTPAEARTDPVGFLCADLEKLLLILQQETESLEKRKVISGIIAATEALPRARGLSLQGTGRGLGLNRSLGGVLEQPNPFGTTGFVPINDVITSWDFQAQIPGKSQAPVCQKTLFSLFT